MMLELQQEITTLCEFHFSVSPNQIEVERINKLFQEEWNDDTDESLGNFFEAYGKEVKFILMTQEKQKQNRPITAHQHSKGPWKIERNRVFKKNLTISNHEVDICDMDIHEGALFNAKLIESAPELLQIAEMYFDSMKGTSAEGSIAWDVTLKTLNKINNQ